MARRKILFEHNPIFTKWAKPLIFGSGDLYKGTMRKSHLRHATAGPSLACYNELISSVISKKLDKIHQPRHLTYSRHMVDMVDGGRIALDEVSTTGSTLRGSLPNIVYCTSLASTSFTPRSRVWSNWFLEAGFPRVFIVNRRGASRVPQYSPRLTMPLGVYNDLPAVMDYLVARQPREKWILVGSCYGANCVLEYFTQSVSNRPEVLGGIVDSFQFNAKKFLQLHYESNNPYFKMAKAAFFSVFIEEALNRAASPKVNDQISALVDRKAFDNLNLWSKKAVRLIYEGLLCKLAGHYQISCQEELLARGYPYYDHNHNNHMKIKKPVVMLYAQDDPFSPFDEDMVDKLTDNPSLCLWLFAGGGHISYTGGVFPYYTSFIRDVYLENAMFLARTP